MTDVVTRILIADDQENVRIGFRLVLDSQPDMTVVGEASNGNAALELATVLKPTWFSPTSECPAWTAWS